MWAEWFWASGFWADGFWQEADGAKTRREVLRLESLIFRSITLESDL